MVQPNQPVRSVISWGKGKAYERHVHEGKEKRFKEKKIELKKKEHTFISGKKILNSYQ